jgi:O-antigen/teichoic acid export membrane protein
VTPRGSRISIGAASLVLRLFAMATGVANVIIIARWLGPADSGRYFVFVALVLLLAITAELGLSQSAAVFVARDARALRDVHRVLLRCAGLFSLIAAVVGVALFMVVGRRILPSIPSFWMVFVAIAVPLALYANLWNNMAVGLTRLVSAGAVQVVTSAITLILNVVLLAGLHKGAFASVVAYVVATAIQGALMMVLARRFMSGLPESGPSSGLARDMVTFGFRGYAGAMSSFLWMRSTVFLLEAFHGPAAVGIFSVAQQMSEKLLLPAQVIRDVIYREVSSEDRLGATRRMDRYLRLTIIGLLPLLIIGAWLAPEIVHLMFGPKFDASALIFRILFIGSVVMIVPTLLTPYFLGQLGRPGLLSVLAWVNVIVNGSLAFWLVPSHAEVGAAIALIATQLLGTAVLLTLYIRYAETSVMRAIVVRSYDIGTMVRQLGDLVRVRGAGS